MHKNGASGRRVVILVHHHVYPRRCTAEETLYWWLHPIERVNTVRGIDAWDGYHCMLARRLAQDEDWVSLKMFMDTTSETYLRETMEHFIQF